MLLRSRESDVATALVLSTTILLGKHQIVHPEPRLIRDPSLGDWQTHHGHQHEPAISE